MFYEIIFREREDICLDNVKRSGRKADYKRSRNKHEKRRGKATETPVDSPDSQLPPQRVKEKEKKILWKCLLYIREPGTNSKDMDLSPFKQDIDELIDEFAQGESSTLTEMKRVWLSRKFSFIFEASPSSNLGFFMQSLYGHSIGHMVNGASLSERLGGLYCLYCLYETQPFRPPYLIYVSLGELTKLRELVVDAKAKGIKVVCALVRRMLEKNMFLLGAVEFNECSVKERINELTDLQNARVGVAYKKLLANTRIEHFLHMDLGAESDVEMLKKMSTDYAKAKELAIKEASEVVDVENVKHLSENKNLIGDVVEKIAEDWTIQKQAFYQKTGFKPPSAQENQEQECDTLGMELALSNHLVKEQEKENDEFDRELELILSNQHQDEENEDQK